MDSKEVHMIDMLNPVETFKDGKRIRDYSVKDILPTSGKLIPEFNNRRSIKDMLTKRPNLPTRQSKETQDTENTVMYLSSTQESITTSTSNSSEFQIQRSSKPLPSSGQRNHNKRSAPSESKSISSKRSKSATSDLTPNQRTIHPFFIQPASPTNPSTPPRPTKLQRSTTNSPSNSFSITSPSPTKQSTSSPAPKSTWSALFAKPIRPNCEGHDEPCKTMATRKRGVNCGRNFWMCAKPLGPSGENDKIKGSQWRCGTFIWGSDWSGSGNTRSGNLTTNTNGNGSTG